MRPIPPSFTTLLADEIGGLVEAGTLPAEPALVLDPSLAAWGDELDPPPPAGEETGSRGVLRSLAAELGARIAPLEAVHSCEPGAIPPRCTLEGADAVLALGQPRLDGDRALVTVRLIHRSVAAPDADSAYRVQRLLELERDAEGWSVVGVRAVSTS